MALGSDLAKSVETAWPCLFVAWRSYLDFSSSILLPVSQECSVLSLIQNFQCFLEGRKNSLEGSFSIKWKEVELSQLLN